MKLLFPLLLLPAILGAFQQSPGTPRSPKGSAANMVTLNCRLYNANPGLDSIYLYENLGLATRIVARGGRRASDSMYVLVVPKSKARFYAVGVNETSVAKVILGEEPEVTLYANAQVMNKARTSNSAPNKAMEGVQKRIEQFRLESEEARNQFRQTTGPAKKESEAALQRLGQSKTKYLDSLKTANPLLWRVASLHIAPDYTRQSGYNSESEFYAKTYFSNANLEKDRAYDDIPDVFPAFENYLRILQQVGAGSDEVKQYTDQMLAKLPAGSKTYRMAFGGLISAAKTANSHLYPIWARQYIEQYKKENYGEVERLDMELKKAGTFTPGFEAPDLAGMTPDSGSYALSKMRGKVVLVDFWASWCGPCRKENPNVKANYAKYKDKGFDILGVSLDREPGAWKKAIQQDGLEWYHISDLKGWQSAHAALYSVTSIPQTVLVDKEGKIIARNVRGEQLGEKLKEIFGE